MSIYAFYKWYLKAFERNGYRCKVDSHNQRLICSQFAVDSRVGFGISFACYCSPFGFTIYLWNGNCYWFPSVSDVQRLCDELFGSLRSDTTPTTIEESLLGALRGTEAISLVARKSDGSDWQEDDWTYLLSMCDSLTTERYSWSVTRTACTTYLGVFCSVCAVDARLVAVEQQWEFQLFVAGDSTSPLAKSWLCKFAELININLFHDEDGATLFIE